MEKLTANELLTIEEAAAFLRIPKGTIYNWTSQKRIPFIKVGRGLRFSRPALEGWLTTLEVKPRKPVKVEI